MLLFIVPKMSLGNILFKKRTIPDSQNDVLRPTILPGCYFYDALEQLKTNFHTNFRFKRVLGIVIEYS